LTASLFIGAPRTALSNSDEWQTPRRLFNACSDHYGPFVYDAFAARWNALCAKFGTKRDSALKRAWPTGTWWNPPYSRGNLWACVGYARAQVARSCGLACGLVPAYTSERWWQRIVMAPGLGRSRVELVDRRGIGSGWRAEYSDLAVEVVFVEGRLRFRHETGVQDSARHPSAVVVFSR
jgi:phage N-6-adenine-methyltransferase